MSLNDIAEGFTQIGNQRTFKLSSAREGGVVASTLFSGRVLVSLAGLDEGEQADVSRRLEAALREAQGRFPQLAKADIMRPSNGGRLTVMMTLAEEPPAEAGSLELDELIDQIMDFVLEELQRAPRHQAKVVQSSLVPA